MNLSRKDRAAIRYTVKRWSRACDGEGLTEGCLLCAGWRYCTDCPVVTVFGANCYGFAASETERDRAAPFWSCEHTWATPEEILLMACMLAAVLEVEIC